ncbi:MAG: 2-C-methyl-D-erythritol 2,4-cyclodiphosphate synthase [Pirellulales bacterium]|nr:2-C-methyl-D-erythritol 2,4-cyclodiphosphate synthase [Pirellulales bacterium]
MGCRDYGISGFREKGFTASIASRNSGGVSSRPGFRHLTFSDKSTLFAWGLRGIIAARPYTAGVFQQWHSACKVPSDSQTGPRKRGHGTLSLCLSVFIRGSQENLAKTPVRIGIGHDSHRLTPGGPLRLGGIDIPHDKAMLGHSDADVLLHAVTDAVLGAAALGDIGQMFPDTEEANRGRDSAEMLAAAWKQVTAAGWRLANLDCTVLAERPKIGPHRETIRGRLAQILGCLPEAISVKAKTGEGVGPIGREETIAAECAVLLERE